MGKPFFPLIALTCAVVLLAGCGGAPAQPVTASEDAEVRGILQGRSFRQFDPNVEGDPRKGLVIEFSGPYMLWGQYSEGRQALNEWEISADDYRIEKHGNISEVTVHFIEPRSSQNLPAPCTGCIVTEGVSVSVRNYFERGEAEFKVNDPNNVLPPPFPVFDSWRRFSEDEYVNRG